jgi:sugar O-acyltransferase (sialic acid O-acetyltransferase NeuD family)
MDYVLIGSGGLASEVVDCILSKKEIGEPVRIVGMVNDSKNLFEEQNTQYGFETTYLGSIETHQYDQKFGYIVAFSNIDKRKKLIFDLLQAGYHLPSIIHPSVSLPRSSSIGQGCFIGPYVVIGRHVRIGIGNIISGYSFVSHDCKIGDFNFLSTAGLAGHVQLGDENFLGIRATVLPHTVVGSRNKVQAGMIVETNVGDDTTIFYRYKEKLHVQFSKKQGDL